MTELNTEVLVVGGGLGGIAAALAALDRGQSVVLCEEFDWLGGQLTSQAVPPDEHAWIERFGATRTYRRLRDGIRDYYRRNYPLTEPARAWAELNPGAGWVSKLCHEPRVAVAVLEEMLAPWRSSGRLRVLQGVRAVAATVDADRVTSVTMRSLADDHELVISTRGFVIDATETGELLPLTGTEYVTGFEAQSDTGEPSAPSVAQPDNQQAISYCFAVDHVDGDHTIDRPEQYDYWRAVEPSFWGAPLLSFTAPNPRTLASTPRGFHPNPGDDPLSVVADQSKSGGDSELWTFRRIAARDLFIPGAYRSDITLVNWPSIDYFDAPILDVEAEVLAERLHAARQLSLSMLYWMQTEAPRPDGGTGFGGLRLRPDVVGSRDGLAQAPYVRESRRIRALVTVVEQDVSRDLRGPGNAQHYADTVGIGMYRIDLHPSTGGDNYLDVAAEPFEIPLGALIPQRMRNLVAASKNIGTTHITNGCYRLHPVEWNVGEVAGHLVASCLDHRLDPHDLHTKDQLLTDFQALLVAAGVELHWPDGVTGY